MKTKTAAQPEPDYKTLYLDLMSKMQRVREDMDKRLLIYDAWEAENTANNAKYQAVMDSWTLNVSDEERDQLLEDYNLARTETHLKFEALLA